MANESFQPLPPAIISSQAGDHGCSRREEGAGEGREVGVRTEKRSLGYKLVSSLKYKWKCHDVWKIHNQYSRKNGHYMEFQLGTHSWDNAFPLLSRESRKYYNIRSTNKPSASCTQRDQTGASCHVVEYSWVMGLVPPRIPLYPSRSTCPPPQGDPNEVLQLHWSSRGSGLS